MKIFIDTANIDEIREAVTLGVIDGVTTNPTLLSREIERTGNESSAILKEICDIVKGPVSGEVIALEAGKMVEEARKLAVIDEHVVIKIPMTEEGLKAVSILSNEGINTNVTLVFSAVQAMLAAKAGATYVSPFVGRLDDTSTIGMDLVEEIKTVFENYQFKTEIIVASVRSPLHVLESAIIGADIATIPFKVIRQLLKHPLTDIGIERFLSDWDKIKK
ncbi:fructose-6-phosphate aldolase [bacterium]|nr:fructose-6-phosphate aldolase [bacterium]